MLSLSTLNAPTDEEMQMRRKAGMIFDKLEELYPNPPKSLLDHTNHFTLLIAVLLSAQTTDEKVNKVTPKLFQLASTPAAMFELGEQRILALIQSVGLANTKARNIVKLARKLEDDHNGEVPNDMGALESLPGVGHKTASVVLMQAFNKPTFPVDTHIHRLASRWGCGDKSVVKTEGILKSWFSNPDHWYDLHIRFILFGRQYCKATRHNMKDCPICSFAATEEAIQLNQTHPKKFIPAPTTKNPYALNVLNGSSTAAGASQPVQGDKRRRESDSQIVSNQGPPFKKVKSMRSAPSNSDDDDDDFEDAKPSYPVVQVNEQGGTPRGRGRPRKKKPALSVHSLNETVNASVSNMEEEDTEENHQADAVQVDEQSERPRGRGRPRKKKPVLPVHSFNETANMEEEDSEENHQADAVQVNEQSGKPRGRGRPRKKKPAQPAQRLNATSNPYVFSLEDDEDNEDDEEDHQTDDGDSSESEYNPATEADGVEKHDDDDEEDEENTVHDGRVMDVTPKRGRGRPRKYPVDLAQEQPSPAVKRPRGRPRKDNTNNASGASQSRSPNTRGTPVGQGGRGRGRGRPRKHPVVTSEIEGGLANEVEVDGYEQEHYENDELVEIEIQKRPRGRPPKATTKTNSTRPDVDANAPKRPRGRPRKTDRPS